MPIPNPTLFEPFVQDEAWFGSFLTRKIPPFYQEVGLDPGNLDATPNPDPYRYQLDKVFFDAIGLGDEELFELYRETVRLIWMRVSQAKTR